MRAQTFALGALLAAVTVAGCGEATVADVCADLAAACDGFPEDSCNAEGDALAQRARDAGCEPQFERFVECIEEQLCAWPGECEADAVLLDVCIEEPPPG